jgi:hypothetical protein
MKTKHFVLAIIFSLSFGGVTFADRQLDRAEILQIFEKLTSQPRKTWIPAGTIEAKREEYKAPKTTDLTEISSRISEEIQEYKSNPNKRELTENLQKMKLDSTPFNVRYGLLNEYSMNSNVVVKFDGDRFYWEINVNSRTDSVKPGPDLEGNFMTDHFDLDFNTRRIFAWDGQKYTTYCLPGNFAMVDSTDSVPRGVNGPLTAGLVPWGYGYYTYENLSALESSAAEKYIDGQTEIHLRLKSTDGSEMLFVMDAGKEYAVMYHLIKGLNSTISKQYANYQMVSGGWVPTTILIEQYDALTDRLSASDFWDFTSVSGDTPTLDSFSVEYEIDALIEHRTHITDKPAMYRNSCRINTDLLLVERLDFAASEGTQAQNCATAALKHVTSQLGKPVTDRQLAQLMNTPDGTTSLKAMKDFALSLGFYCRAVKTDVQTLANLSGCEVILHIPGKNHFVVLEGIDNQYVWSIDLTNDKFYYRTDLGFFGMDWTEGTALLISNRPIQPQGDATEIGDAQLSNIIGGEGYTCTRIIQVYNWITCANPVEGVCLGYYRVYIERWGCEYAESGSCVGSLMVRYADSPCIVDPYNPFGCYITMEWYFAWMRACN